ncbi:transposable element Tcb2 transposase [Trichonephila clavipes]|nr:transposable element Tcb2 transposase [Trichonephila clavipes]
MSDEMLGKLVRQINDGCTNDLHDARSGRYSINIPTQDDCYEARLTIHNVEGGDSKTYTLVVENEKGRETFSVALEVREPFLLTLMIGGAIIIVLVLICLIALLICLFKREKCCFSRTTIRGLSSGRPRGTTPADDRYIVLQARRNRRQTAGEIARHTTQATGRPISRFTVARRLHGGGLFAQRPVRCVPLTPAHRRRPSLWCSEHRNWRDNEWGRVIITDESRFSLSSDSHRILIWRERVSRNHPSNIIERDRYGGRGVLVWGSIMLGSRTDLHIFDAGSVNGTRYFNEILLPYVRLFRGAMGL